jgi:hypothetical protein
MRVGLKGAVQRTVDEKWLCGFAIRFRYPAGQIPPARDFEGFRIPHDQMARIVPADPTFGNGVTIWSRADRSGCGLRTHNHPPPTAGFSHCTTGATCTTENPSPPHFYTKQSPSPSPSPSTPLHPPHTSNPRTFHHGYQMPMNLLQSPSIITPISIEIQPKQNRHRPHQNDPCPT